MSMNRELLKIREEIDAIDQQIQDLINARADCAMRVAEVKQAEMAGLAKYLCITAPSEKHRFWRG